jgi:hypothetical protein
MEVSMESPKIPVELLKTFQADLRVIPTHLPVAGYITFDRAMLTAILRSQDSAARERLAAALQKLDPQWDLVFMTRTEETVTAGR